MAIGAVGVRTDIVEADSHNNHEGDNMEHQPQMQFVVTGNDPDAAIAVATATGGTAYVD